MLGEKVKSSIRKEKKKKKTCRKGGRVWAFATVTWPSRHWSSVRQFDNPSYIDSLAHKGENGTYIYCTGVMLVKRSFYLSRRVYLSPPPSSYRSVGGSFLLRLSIRNTIKEEMRVLFCWYFCRSPPFCADVSDERVQKETDTGRRRSAIRGSTAILPQRSTRPIV